MDYEERHIIPEMFWTSSVGDSSRRTAGPVESVSAIIGENGTGKTSVASLLYELLSGARFDVENDSMDVSSILILLREDTLLVKVAGKDKPSIVDLFSSEKVTINGKTVHIRLVDKQPVDMIYYSPVFSIARDEGKSEWNIRDRFFDISTTGLLHEAIREGFTRKEDPMKIYEEKEIRLVLEFLWRLQKRNISPKDFPQPLPQYVAIGATKPALETAKEQFNRNAHLKTKAKQAGQIRKTLNGYLSKLSELSCPTGSFLITAFYSFGVQYLAGILVSSMGQLRNLIDEFAFELFRTLKVVCDERDGLSQRNEAVLDFLTAHSRPSLSIRGEPLKSRIPLRSVFLQISKLQTGNRDYHRIQVKQGSSHWQDMMELVRLHRKCLDCGLFLSFSFPTAISSGELSFLSMFGRLSEQFNNLSQNMKKRQKVFRLSSTVSIPETTTVHTVVFFDEAETSLHPEWQRKLVSHSIAFFEKIHPQVRAHLIFASHSPILLSDVPKDNAVILFPQSEKDSCEEMYSEDEWGQTFGANIFDLYRYPFVLRDGPCGEFAKQIIDRALSACNKRMNTKTGKQIRETTNEFKQIEQLIDLVGDPTIQAYIENAMDWMPPHNIKLDH